MSTASPQGTGGVRWTPATVVAVVVASLVGTLVVVFGGLAVLGTVLVASSGTESPVSVTTSAPVEADAPGVAAPLTPSVPTPSPTPSVAASPSPSARPTAAASAKPRPPASSGLVPVVGVVDGDTIKVRVGGVTERVRVIGIDTPELRGDECYARQASSRMQSLVQSRSVRLVRDRTQADRDRYDRLLRHVQLADGRQVAKILIAGGFGEEYTYDQPYAGQAEYRAAEQAARAAEKGIWGSGCRTPVKAAPTSPTSPGRCVIKGNISSEGERIYHVPGGQFYEVTKIDTSKGERWFCTESQARDAGWRPSQR